MWRARMAGARGRRRREPEGSTSRATPVELTVDAPARTGRGIRKHAMRKVEHGAAAALESVRAAPGKASRATRAAAGKVSSASRKTFEAATPLADWVHSIGQGLLASALSHDLNALFASAVQGPATVYDKAMDAAYLAAHIGGGNHRMFDGGHSAVGAFEAVRDALPDDSLVEEAFGYVQSMFRDMTTPKGLPLATWDKVSYDQVAGYLEAHFRIPKEWFYDLNSYDAAELLGGVIGVVSVALCWNRADTETFSKLVGGMGLAAVRGANPLLLIVTVVALARAFHKAHQAGDYSEVADGALKGALGTGATLAATAQVAALGGPAGLALLAGVCAGVLAHQATKRVKVARVGRFVAARAKVAASEIRGRARRRGRSPQRLAAPFRALARPARS